MIDEPLEKQPLAIENFDVRGRKIKPCRAIDFREGMHRATFRRPSDLERLLFIAPTSRSPSTANAVIRWPPEVLSTQFQKKEIGVKFAGLTQLAGARSRT